ncbi:putative fluoride ion transporter CrcB [Lupinus albus]|nr:putative fluoride ion transporter CrcB [Lupinus albus]
MFNTTFQFIYFFFSKSFFFILSQQQPPSPPPQPSLILAPHPCLNPNADTHQQQLPQFINLLMLPLHSFTPLPPELTSPLSTDAIVSSEETKQEPRKGFPMWLDYASCMFQLAVFGIFGVLTRYLLQKLFGPGNAGVTSNHTLLYLDLPSNMVGSFLMGWFGVVFKGDIISHVSEHIAIAITTGYLGSLTTFSGWNQKILELAVLGHWLFAVLGFFIGMLLVASSIVFGIETATGFRYLLNKLNISSGNASSKIKSKLDTYTCNAAQLWFACLVGPIGVWIRWFLARLNGRGLGKAGSLKWIPFGTLIANVSASCVMAALASLKEAVNTRDCDTIVAGIQFGLMGCLSTVSTFVAEFNTMRKGIHPWRAYAYAIITICVSFSLGILIYCVPVWTRGFDIDT